MGHALSVEVWKELQKICCVYTIFSMPVLGTWQRTEASWECLKVHGWTSWKKQSKMERSDPLHCTLFIWIGPVPEEGRRDVVDLKTNDKSKAGETRSADITKGVVFLWLSGATQCGENGIRRFYPAKHTQRSKALCFLSSESCEFLYFRINPTRKIAICRDETLLPA